MRIIAGEFRRRTLHSPKGLVTRPMPDRVKESVFSMLGVRIEDAACMDLFAGSGAVGLEALSRGARSCVFVERDRHALDALDENIDMLGCIDRSQVVAGDALGLSILARCPRPADLIFLDPPYPMVRDPLTWDRVRGQCAQLVRLLADDGFLVLRTPWPFLMEVGGGAEEGAPARSEVIAPKGKERGKGRGKGSRAEKAERRGSPTPREGAGPREWVAGLLHDAGAGGAGGAGATGGAEVGGKFRWDAPQRGGKAARAAREAERLRLISEGEIDDDRPVDAGDPSALTGRDERLVDGSPESGIEATPAKVIGDLAIEGARGPETHAYGSTAVHWYMKRV